MKLLLIGSDAQTEQKLTDLALELGHEVLGVTRPDESIPFLNGFWPDGIVIDFFCEGTGDGKTAVDFSGEILELFGEIPPFVIHSLANEHRFLATRFPQFGYLIAPFNAKDLALALDQVVSKTVSLTG